MDTVRHKARARALAVLGTGSDVGKSMLVAGLCRLVYRAGISVAPFKAQNMSNNAAVTRQGGEIGRAQALQAEACGIESHVDMNPILLKPDSDESAQVVMQGRVRGRSDASALFDRTSEFRRIAYESYSRLANRVDAIILEGAGSAAEVNLRHCDVANWPMVDYADASVLLVADIDRGGVFAQVLGTLDLLTLEERRRIIGVVINKFRGRRELFVEGTTFLEKRSGIPVLGVVPFLSGLRLDQEDSLDHGRQTVFSDSMVNVAVVLLPRMSNFTDFNALAAEPGVALCYADSPEHFAKADVVIIPGSKNTIADMRYIYEQGIAARITTHASHGGELVGLCGGYQMLGRSVEDPFGAEAGGLVQGLGLLNVSTQLGRTKITQLVEAIPLHFDFESTTRVKGYRIHMGVTVRTDERPCFQLCAGSSADETSDVSETVDGAMNASGLIWGSYIHGMFDEPEFRAAWLNRIRARKGVPLVSVEVSRNSSSMLRKQMDRWADHLAQHLDIQPLWRALNHGAGQ